MATSTRHPPIRNPNRTVLRVARARQSRHGRQVLWGLLVSTALATLALFGAWTWNAPDLSAADQGAHAHPGATFTMDAPTARGQSASPATAR